MPYENKGESIIVCSTMLSASYPTMQSATFSRSQNKCCLIQELEVMTQNVGNEFFKACFSVLL